MLFQTEKKEYTAPVKNLAITENMNTGFTAASFKYGIMLLALVSFFQGCGCNEQSAEYTFPEFRKNAEAEFEIISEELFGLNAISDIEVHDSTVIVTAVSMEDGKILHIYDKDSGAPLMHTLNYGRGPKELLFASNCSFDKHTATMTFFDNLASKKLTVNMDSLLVLGIGAIKRTDWQAPRWNVHDIVLEKGTLLTYNISFLQRDTSSVKRMALKDRLGDVISTYDRFPEIDDDRKRFMMYTNEIIAASPNGERFAVTSSLGGILETFSVENGTIKNLSTRYFVEPDFKIEGNRYVYDDLTDAFCDLYADDEVIFAAFGGETRMSGSGQKEQIPPFRNVAIFDWKGNALEQIRTDHRIDRLCFVKEENTIYAVIKDPDGKSYIGRIRL